MFRPGCIGLDTPCCLRCSSPPVRWAGRSGAVENDEREKLSAQLARDVEHLEAEGRLLRRVVAYIKPTVVHIDAERPEEGRPPSEETGSGVIVRIKDQDYVVTNRHVIKGTRVNKIRIRTADGRQIAPTKVWSDKGTDVAVLAVSAPDLVSAKIGDSDQTEIGDYVLAVGSPFGLSHSVTFGIISAKVGATCNWVPKRCRTRTSCRPTRRSIQATVADRS